MHDPAGLPVITSPRAKGLFPAPFQRADSEDLLAVVFPDQLACAENLAGAREIPDQIPALLAR